MEDCIQIDLVKCYEDIKRLRELVEKNKGCIIATDPSQRNSVSIRIESLDRYINNCAGLAANDMRSINKELINVNERFIEMVNATIKLLDDKKKGYKKAEDSNKKLFD